MGATPAQRVDLAFSVLPHILLGEQLLGDGLRREPLLLAHVQLDGHLHLGEGTALGPNGVVVLTAGLHHPAPDHPAADGGGARVGGAQLKVQPVVLQVEDSMAAREAGVKHADAGLSREEYEHCHSIVPATSP